jgi:hypothetical protein
MYGYSYGCAAADVWHTVLHTAMLYPGYDVVEPPKVLHYGLLWNVPGTQYSFDKHWHYSFDPLSCPPWQIGWAAHGLAAGGGQAARWRGRRDGQGCQSTTCGGPLPVWEWGRGRDERPHH